VEQQASAAALVRAVPQVPQVPQVLQGRLVSVVAAEQPEAQAQAELVAMPATAAMVASE
jgi:hypothetical protein